MGKPTQISMILGGQEEISGMGTLYSLLRNTQLSCQLKRCAHFSSGRVQAEESKPCVKVPIKADL